MKKLNMVMTLLAVSLAVIIATGSCESGESGSEKYNDTVVDRITGEKWENVNMTWQGRNYIVFVDQYGVERVISHDYLWVKGKEE